MFLHLSISLLYQLPHPLTVLTSSKSKEAWKKLFKKHVLNYWEIVLRDEASNLKSLKYFKPQFMSLVAPHPVFITAGSSPYEVIKAQVQALFLSGRYRTELMCRFWSENPGGYCQMPSCQNLNKQEDIEHILLYCDSLSNTRKNLVSFTIAYALSV